MMNGVRRNYTSYARRKVRIEYLIRINFRADKLLRRYKAKIDVYLYKNRSQSGGNKKKFPQGLGCEAAGSEIYIKCWSE